MKKLRTLSICLLAILLLLSACSTAPSAVTPNEPTGDPRQVYPSENKDTPDAAAIPNDGDIPQGNADDGNEVPGPDTQTTQDELDPRLPINGESYYDLTNVVLYLEVYDELPPNYITKNDARALGWDGGSVEKYKEGAAIGGDFFGNYEGLLPDGAGQRYTECDIDTDGYPSRGSRRLVFSNDGRYFYTSDHYESFSEYRVTADYEVIPCE